MKAIAITQELKDLNPSILKGMLGFIKTFKEIPKSFHSLTWGNGRITEGYHKLDNSVHEADGFYNIVTPTFDNNLQRLGELYFNVYDVEVDIFENPSDETPIGTETRTIKEFTYTLVDIPQAEIDEKIIKDAKDEFKNNLEGVFQYATTPDGTKEYAIKLGNDGKISTVLIP